MKIRPKIAFLIPGFGVVDRGAEHVVFELAKRLSRSFEITVFARGRKTELEKQGVLFRKIKVISRDNQLTNFFYRFHPKLTAFLDCFCLDPAGFEMLSFSLVSLSVLLFGKYDLLFPVSGFWGALFCRLVRAMKQTPFVYASHGGEEPMIARQKPDLYIALTLYTKKWLKSFRPSLKVVHIPNGVDTEIFSPRVKPVELKLERPIFLTVAALIPAKRIDLAIRAVAQLKKGSLLVLGEGALKDELNKLGRRLLGGKRFLLKKAVYENMPAFYSAADVFTLPSLMEPSPLVYLEAAAVNLPIVAPDEERRRSILGRAALYCDVEDLPEYARVLRAASKKDFDRRPRKQAEKFDWEKIGERYKKELGRLVELK